MSKIQWTEETWNPLAGCKEISPGCTNCYAAKMAKRLEAMGQKKYAGTTKTLANGKVVWTGKINMDEGSLTLPLRTKKPTMWFVNSMSDLFHEDVPDEFILRVFGVMMATPWHTYQVLTKRAERLPAWFEWWMNEATRQRYLNLQTGMAHEAVADLPCDWKAAQEYYLKNCDQSNRGRYDNCILWPLFNVWLGVSVEDQQRADERIPHLLKTPAAVRFLSCEPLLGPVDLERVLFFRNHYQSGAHHYIDVLRGGFWSTMPAYRPSQDGEPKNVFTNHSDLQENGLISWVIIGSESGPKRRPMKQEWAEQIAAQCEAVGVKWFMKQMEVNGRVSGDIDAFPQKLRIRQMPEVSRG